MESNSKKVIKGISSQTIVTIVYGVLEIIVFSIMSRLLSKEDFGLYASVTAITVVFNSLSEAGIGSAIIQKKDANDDYINTAFSLSIILGTFFSILLLSSSYYISIIMSADYLYVPLMCMSVTILFHSLLSVNNSMLTKQLKFFKVGMINLSALLISSIVAILLAYQGFGYYAIITKAVMGGFVSMAMSFFVVKHKYRFIIYKEHLKSIIGFGGWLTLSTIIRNLSHQADKLLMTKYLSPSSLGAYNRPKEFITNITTKLNSIFDSVLFPVLSGIQDEKKKLKSAFEYSYYYLNIFSLLLAAGFMFNSELIIRIFFGKQWLDLVPLFNIFALYVLFYTDGRLCDSFLRSLGLVRYQFRFRIVELILTILLLLLAFRWDVYGVAVAMVLAQVIMVVLKLIFIVKKININFGFVLRTTLSSWKIAVVLIPVMTFSVIFLPHTLFFNLITAIIFVVTLIICFFYIPSIVGSLYKNHGYNIVRDVTSRHIKHIKL